MNKNDDEMASTRIKELLAEKGITAKELAEKIGMSESGISIMLSDRGNPTLLSLRRIAECLDVELYELFTCGAVKGHTCPHCGKSIKITLS